MNCRAFKVLKTQKYILVGNNLDSSLHYTITYYVYFYPWVKRVKTSPIQLFKSKSQYILIERDFFKWVGKETKIWNKMWKITFFTTTKYILQFFINRLMSGWSKIFVLCKRKQKNCCKSWTNWQREILGLDAPFLEKMIRNTGQKQPY